MNPVSQCSRIEKAYDVAQNTMGCVNGDKQRRIVQAGKQDNHRRQNRCKKRRHSKPSKCSIWYPLTSSETTGAPKGNAVTHHKEQLHACGTECHSIGKTIAEAQKNFHRPAKQTDHHSCQEFVLYALTPPILVCRQDSHDKDDDVSERKQTRRE